MLIIIKIIPHSSQADKPQKYVVARADNSYCYLCLEEWERQHAPMLLKLIVQQDQSLTCHLEIFKQIKSSNFEKIMLLKYGMLQLTKDECSQIKGCKNWYQTGRYKITIFTITVIGRRPEILLLWIEATMKTSQLTQICNQLTELNILLLHPDKQQTCLWFFLTFLSLTTTKKYSKDNA